ncbi:hypothetical protein Tco_0340687 [Tanacetum coccineum]
MPGRPRKKKVKASHEPKSNTRILRSGTVITCQNYWETRHNKKGCKKDPIAAVPKEKKKVGRQKKIPNTENLEKDNDVLAFVNTDINKFEMGYSNSSVVFNDGRVINVGKFNFNKKRMFGSFSTSHVKMSGGKTKGGRLVPAQRRSRASTSVRGGSQTRARIATNKAPRTQKGGFQRASLGARKTRSTASVRGGSQLRATTAPQFIPPRMKSLRIPHNKVSASVKGTRSSKDNDIILE